MNFYLLFMVFLYVRGCNARVVPLNFKIDKSEHVDSSVNELIDESPMGEVEILGHNLPHIGQNKDLELSNSEEDNTTVPEISKRNASNLSPDLVPKEMDVDEESNLKSAGSSAIFNVLEKRLNSTVEYLSQNNLDSRDRSKRSSPEAVQVNETRNNTEEFQNETSITNNSSLDLEKEKNLDFVKIEKVLNNTLDHRETADVANSDQNETFVSSEVAKSDQNEAFVSSEVAKSDQNETFVSSEVAKSDQNETFASFEAVNSDQNETSIIIDVNDANNTNGFSELQLLTNETEVEAFSLNDAENITEKIKTNNLTSENLELTNNSAQTAGGIFSGFEFIINSEVARNAAKAMEVFNFSDPLTDHIMEENEFHSFLPAFNAEQDLDSPNQTDVNATAIFTNSSEESSDIRAGIALSSGNETSISPNQAEAEEIEKNSSVPLNLNVSLGESNKTVLFDLEEKLQGNVTSEKTSPLGNSEVKTEEKNTISTENNSSAAGVPECPPAGWCIFSFLSQDACAVNEHCLGSRICCRIGCSKACIEVESL